MIFKPGQRAKVLDGTKTMTRRRLPCRYRAGGWYKAQPGRGKKHVCHIYVTGVRTERLGDITYGDARREGFDSGHSFVGYWRRIHGGFDSDERVAVIEWDVGTRTALKDCCAELEGR